MFVKALHKNQAVSLEIIIDPSFRGILRGVAHDESEGCMLTGQVIMTVNTPTKLRRLETSFVGHLEVEFKTTNSVGVPTSDGSERRNIYKKSVVHLDSQSEYHPGTYCFPFEFAIPAAAPQSFNGKHGSIRYEVTANAFRTSFNSDIHAAHPITLRRCRMNSLDPVAPATQTVNGLMHPEIVTYSATAPSMVYCEGGLLKLNLNMHLKDPQRYRVRVVTCGLQEIVYYRTTGTRSLTNQACHHEEITYPLGYSTFFPSKHPEYDPFELHDYNAVFRLYPKVNTDNRSSLIVVHHAMFIRILIDDTTVVTQKKVNSTVSTVKSIISHLSKSEEAQLMEQNLPEFGPTNIEESLYNIPNQQQREEEQEEQEEQEEEEEEEEVNNNNISNSYLFNQRNSATPPLSPTNSEFSLSSMSEQFEYQQPSTVVVSPRKSRSNFENTEESGVGATDSSDTETRSTSSLGHLLGHTLAIHHHLKPSKHVSRLLSENGVYECHLTIPITVTSREEYDEGHIPAIPDYEDALFQQDPPTYEASVERLPPAPMYRNNSITSSN